MAPIDPILINVSYPRPQARDADPSWSEDFLSDLRDVQGQESNAATRRRDIPPISAGRNPRSQLSSTTNIHFSPFCLYFCIVLGMVSSLDPSLATLICPPSSFTAVMSVFSEMLLRWPLYCEGSAGAHVDQLGLLGTSR